MAINPQAVRGPVTAVPVVAGKGVRLREDVENNRVVAEIDETVLFDDDTGVASPTLSEIPMNFERIKVFFGTSRSGTVAKNIGMNYTEVLTSSLTGGRQGNPSNGFLTLQGFFYGDNSAQTTPYMSIGEYANCHTTTWSRKGNGYIIALDSAGSTQAASSWIVIYKIIGINRVSA